MSAVLPPLPSADPVPCQPMPARASHPPQASGQRFLAECARRQRNRWPSGLRSGQPLKPAPPHFAGIAPYPPPVPSRRAGGASARQPRGAPAMALRADSTRPASPCQPRTADQRRGDAPAEKSLPRPPPVCAWVPLCYPLRTDAPEKSFPDPHPLFCKGWYGKNM